MKKINDYKTYDEYINHQLEKTLNPKTIKSHRVGRNEKIEYFEKVFKYSNMPKYAEFLCIGSRYGEEIETLNKLGFNNAVGIDLAAFPPYTKKMDMHDLKYKDNTFRCVYTNSLDHSYDVEKALSEMVRVVDTPSVIIIDIELYNNGEYETVEFKSKNDIINIMDKLNIKYRLRDISMLREITDSKLFYIDNSKRLLIFTIYEKL